MKFLPILLVFVLATTTAFAADPGPLQDFCIGVNSTKDGVFVNGKFCKDPELVTGDDFVFTGFRTPGDTSNPLGSKVTPSFVDEFPGENTLGLSMGRIDFAPGGLNPLHTHPRASEIFQVIEGTLYAGFVTSNQNGNHLYTKILYPGDLMVFPIGLIHFQLNIGKTKGLAFASFGSQNPGIITIANSTFGSEPSIPVDVLTKAFQVDKKVIEALQSQFLPEN